MCHVCKKEKRHGIKKVCVFVPFMNSFARDACVSELLADIKGQKKMFKNGREEGLTDERKTQHFYCYVPAEFGV